MSARGSTVALALALVTATAVAATADAQILGGSPSVSIDAPADGTTVRGTVNVTGNASDSGFGGSVEKVEVKVDENGTWREANGTEPFKLAWNTRLWESGNHTVTARATDDDGNTATDSIDVTVNQAPNLTIRQPRDDRTVAGEILVGGTAEDPEEDLERVEVRVDHGPWRSADGTTHWQFGWDTTTVEDGEHTVSARALDGNGTPAESSTVNVTVNVSNERENPPSVTIQAPEDGATLQGFVEARGTAHDPEGELEEVLVRVDAGPWQAVDGREDWQFGWDTEAVADGNHTLTVRASDQGSTTLAHVNVTVNNEGPLSVTTPQPQATVRGNVTVAGTVQDPDRPVEAVEVQVDTGPWREANGTEDWSFDWDTTAVEDGPHTIAVRAVGEQGVVATTTVPVRVSNDERLEATAAEDGEPVLRLKTTPEGRTVKGSFTLAGTVEDPDDAKVSVEYRIDQGSWHVFTVPSGEPFEREVDVSEIEPGEHTVTVRATDGDQTSEDRTFRTNVDGGLMDVPGPGAWLVLGLALAALVRADRSRR